MLRGKGNSIDRIKCFEPILENLDEITEIVNDILETKNLDAIESYVIQSRAMGTCKPDSDIDMYIALDSKHNQLIEDKGVYIYEGKQPTQFTGNWHPVELEPIDPWTLKHYWPHKVLHDTHANEFYDEQPKISKNTLDKLEKHEMHINFGIHPIPFKKIEYTSRYYISFSELKMLKEILYD